MVRHNYSDLTTLVTSGNLLRTIFLYWKQIINSKKIKKKKVLIIFQ